MSRINNIKSALQAAIAEPTTFDELPLGAQVKVVNAVLYRAASGKKWWESIVDDEEQSPEFRKRAIAEVHAREKVIPSCQDFLTRAAHFSSGADEEVCFDAAYNGEEGITGDYEYAVTTVNGHPFAWARASLIQSGMWDETVSPSDTPLAPQLLNVDKVYDRYAARYAATLLLLEYGLLVPREDDTPSDVVLIAALSPALRKVLASDTVHTLFKAFEKSPFVATHYEDGKAVSTSYTHNDLIALWRKAIKDDKEDAEHDAAIAEREARVHALRQAAQQAITTAVILREMTALSKDMKAAGMSDEAIAEITQAALA